MTATVTILDVENYLREQAEMHRAEGNEAGNEASALFEAMADCVADLSHQYTLNEQQLTSLERQIEALFKLANEMDQVIHS